MNSAINHKCIAFNIPFNNLKPLPHINVATDPKWIKRRIDIFMNYTLKSLKAQNCQEFIACILYNSATEEIILEELSHYPSLPANVLFMPETAYDNYISNYIKGSTYFYEIEMASDNMYHRDFVSYLSEYIHIPSTKLLICQNGYIYSSITQDLAEYFNYSSCFNCKVYNTLHYEQGVRHNYVGFEGAILLPHEKITWRTYIAHAHSDNIAFNYTKESQTPWGYEKAHLGHSITSLKEKEHILSEFMTIFSTNIPPIKDKSIIFNIPLNNLDPLSKIHVALDPNWIEKRIDIFMNYTLKSLKAQSSQDFMAYILYNPTTEAIILNYLSRYPALPPNVHFIPANLYTQYVNTYIKESLYLYEIELASDDLYHRDFVSYLKDYTPHSSTHILICQEGYIYSSTTDELAPYFNYSSSFNCLIYSTKDFINGIRYHYTGFEGAINLPHEFIPWRTYINHSHAHNITFSYSEEQRTPWGKTKAHLEAPITNSLEKKSILSQFTGSGTAFKHIFRIKFNVSYKQFNNPFLEVRLTKEWMAYRLAVFMKYTYPSLVNQTDQNFIVLIAYDSLSDSILKKLLEDYPPLAPNVIFTSDMPGEIKKLIIDSEYAIFTYWDSDNILHPDLVRKIHEVDPTKHQAVINQNGYVYDLARHILGCYSHQAPDTFYSVIYKAKEYVNGFRYPFSANSYEEFITGFPCLSLNPYILTERNFLILIHNKNISHVIENMLGMRSVTHLLDDADECATILKEFGCPVE